MGSQILTHYPHNRQIAKEITKKEAQAAEEQTPNIHIPELARDVLEQISFEARKSDYVDAKSGVSARMSITAFENLLSTAERRMLISGETKTSLRMADFLQDNFRNQWQDRIGIRRRTRRCRTNLLLPHYTSR